MADVKRGNGISSLPLTKPLNFNHSSSSYKHIYDDVFASPIQSRQQPPTFIEDDYAEMFGSSRSNNGTWSISYSSIPVLDLPPPSEMRVRGASGVTTVPGERGGEVDYTGVFGGFADGNFGLPDGEELFDQFNKIRKSSLNVIPRGKVQAMEPLRTEILRQSQNVQSPTSISTQSTDSLPDFERKKNKAARRKSGEITKAAHAHDFPGATHKMEEALLAQTTLSRKTPATKDGTQLGKDVELEKTQGKNGRHMSMDFGADAQEKSSDFPKESDLIASNSVDMANDMSQPAKGLKNLLSQPSDSEEQLDHMKNETLSTETSDAICATDVESIHESTSTVYEVDPTRNNMSSETSFAKDDTETKMGINTAEKQGKHSRNSSSEFKASKHSSVSSLDESQEACQPSLEGGISKTAGDDFSINFDVRRKKHSRITSLDLRDHRTSREGDEQLQRKPRLGSSYSFDASHDPQTAHVKVHPSMMAPSSSVPQFFPVESHYKVSENSSWGNFGSDVHKGFGVSPPSLEEQLDMNSDAALSVAALQRAIEEAAMIIQMAKKYLEMEGQGSSKLRFKDTLKVKVAKDEMDKFQQARTHENFLPTDTSMQKHPFLKETFKAKVIKDSQLADEMNRFQQTTEHGSRTPIDDDKERYSLSQRKSVLGNDQPSVSEDPKFFEDKPVLKDQKESVLGEGRIEETIMYNDGPLADSEKERFSVSERNVQSSLLSEDPKKSVEDDRNVQDRKNFILDKGCIEERNPNMSNLIDERDREESGGEWEAAKHLNQLLCGVKNKIASFMAWQSDTEKKEDLMETRPSRRSQLQSEESQPGLVDVQNTKVKSAEKNQDDIDCPGEHVEMEIGFLSETVEPYENESFLNNIAGQEMAKSCVDLNPNIAVFASEKFMFCPFRNEGVRDSSDSNVEGNNGSDECTEIEFTSLHDKVLDEMKDEQLPGKCEKPSHEALDEICTTLDRVEPETNTEETNEMVEEPCFLPVKDRNEVTDEEVSNRSKEEECREDLITFSHLPESMTEKVDESGKCEGCGVTEETENCEHDAQILEETNLEGEIEMSIEATGGTRRCQEIDKDLSQTGHIEEVAEQMDGGHEFITNDIPTEQDAELEEDVPAKASFIEIDTVSVQTESTCIEAKASYVEIDTVSLQTESSCIEVIPEEMAEEESSVPASDYEHAKTEIEHREDKSNDPPQQAACFVKVEDDSSSGVEDAVSSGESRDMTMEEMADESSITAAEYERTKTENEHIEDATNDLVQQAACVVTVEDGSSSVSEEAVSSHENSNLTTEIPNQAAEPQLEKEETVLFYDSFVELDGFTEDLDVRNTLQFENSVLDSSQSDVYARKEEIETTTMEVESLDILENRTKHVHDFKETLNVGEVNTMDSQESEKCGIEAVQRRRRWFDDVVKVVPTEPSCILEGNVTDMETDQEVLDESVLDGSVEVHVDELDSDRCEVIYSKGPDIAVAQDSGSFNLESTPKRRRWSVKIGEEGLPVPPPIFQGIDVNLEESPKNVNETLPHSKSESSLHKLNAESGKSQNVTESDVSLNGGKDKKSVEAAPRRKRWFGSGENMEQLENSEDAGTNLGIDQESKLKGPIESPTRHEAEVEQSKVESVTDKHLDEVNKKEKEKEKERIVVERAIREARERAFAEAKERARRDASERPNVDARQKSVPGAQERTGKVPSEARTSADKALDAKLRAERAAVERATSEARERALQKSLSEKDSHRSREHAGRFPPEKNMSQDPTFHSSSSSSRVDLSNKSEKYDGLDGETAQKRKARMVRQSRPMERPANALEEKNRRDLSLQKEQAAKNMIADSLDAEVKRWSSGKEGNLRVLLSTLQYILGPESGWQAISLTDLVPPIAVRKAYKKATLCVHPDKLQQRGATIQQKYICEKVFELLKDAWSKLIPDER